MKYPVSSMKNFIFFEKLFFKIVSIIKLTNENVRFIIEGIRDSGYVSSGVTIGNDEYIFVNSLPGVFVVLKKNPTEIVAMKTYTGKNKRFL
jgi:hypothetical protein